MMAPINFLRWILGIAFIIGMAEGFGHITYEMAKAAMHAHQYDQLSYGRFSRLLTADRPIHKKPAHRADH